MLKKALGFACCALLLSAQSGIAAQRNGDQVLEKTLRQLDTQLEATISSFKKDNLDVTFFGRKGDGYVRLFTTLAGMRNTELKSEIVVALKKNGSFVGDNVTVGNFTCERAMYKAKLDGNYVLFVGKNCK